MINNVWVYGGSDPAGPITTLVNTRISEADGSTLSSDIGTLGNADDNVYHAAISSGAVGSILLDGFTVTGPYSTALNFENIIVNNNCD